jgi:hypothetical protein
MPIPSDGTTFSHNIKEDGNAIRITLLKSLQKHCQMVFSRFLAMTIFIPAENTQHSEFPGHIPAKPLTYIEQMQRDKTY